MASFKGRLRAWSKDLSKALDESKEKVNLRLASRPKPQNDPALCSTCSGITWEALRNSYIHQPDYWALKESAKSCPLCMVLLRSLQTVDELPAVNEGELEETDSRIALEGSRMKDGDGWEDQLFLKCGYRMKIIDVHVIAASNAVRRRRIQDSADSEANFEWLKEQLHTCTTTHKGCSLGNTGVAPLTDTPQKLPSRVLDVGPMDGSEPVKLVETKHVPGQYVALSHCWGKKQIITTTKDTKDKDGNLVKGTIDQHYVSIPFEELSKTFREAVIVCRKLNMRYLWIDSLCIIQNDADDWARESAYMGDIYRTATFSIMAAGADAGAIGCFVPRSRPALEPIKLQYLDNQGQIETLSIGLPRGSLHAGLEDGPLQSRAWCLQERVLSRRTIHFCKEHIVWECQMASIVEDDTHLDGALGMERYQIKLHDSMGTSSHLRHPLQGRWRRIVQDYTHRDITQVTDKLPAISGLAQKVHEESKDVYAAGLWKDHLYNDLFWLAEDHMSPATPYRAPTWSWAAYDGAISYNEVFDMKTIYFESTLLDVEVYTNPITVNAFGQIDAGHITCRGRLGEAIYSADPTKQDAKITQHAKEIYELDRSEVTDVPGGLMAYGIQLGYGAIDAKCDEEQTVLCLSIATKPQSPGPYHAVLLVQPTGQDGTEYRRIGAAFIRPKDWFDNVQYQQIKLV